jgi:predicted CxxxxCH...CXXCH cytochrome family protein
VGAHQTHLAATLTAPVACGECHPVPTSTTHANGVVEVQFGTLSRTGGAAPAWNGTTCAGSYCHGATLASPGAAIAPTWTTVDGTQRQCGSCHAASPTSGAHGDHRALTCGACHGTGYSQTSVAVSTHIDGTIELASSTGWQPSSRTCTNSCHGTHSWSGGG